MNNQVADYQATRLVFGLQLLSNDSEDTPETCFARRRVCPVNDLVQVFTDDQCERVDTALRGM